MSILIFGHKNPDTDSVCSAIGYSSLKRRLGIDALPAVAGPITKESRFVLDYFGLEPPMVIQNVKTQVRDLHLEKIPGVPPSTSILSAYQLMENREFPTLPVLDDNQQLMGIVSMKDN